MRFFTYTLLIILTTTFFPIISTADDSSSDSQFLLVDHQKAVEMALGNNQLVYAAERMVSAARAEGKAQYAPFLPQLSTTYSYTRLDSAPFMSVDLGDGPQHMPMGTEDNYKWSFQFVFPIYAGGAKKAVKKMIQINEEIARNNLDIARRGIAYGAVQAYYGVLSTRRLVEVRTASLEFLTEAHRNAQLMQREGFFHASDVLQMDVAKGRAQMDLRAAQDMEHTAVMSFCQILGLDIDSNLETLEPDKPSRDVEFDRRDVVELALRQNGEIQEANLQIDMLTKRLQMVKAGKRPSLNFISQYSNEGDTFKVSGNGLGGDPNLFSATLQLSWSIYDSKQISSEMKQLEESIAALEIQRKDVSQKLEISINKSLDDYFRALDNIDVTSENLKSATENLRILNERFNEGLERTTNLLEGETLLAGAKLEYNQSIYDSYGELAKLAMESGFETTDVFLETLLSK
jgi:outer membrane protein TolC